MAYNNFALTMFTILLVLQQHFKTVHASRPVEFHPPAIPSTRKIPRPPSTFPYKIHHLKKVGPEAFRPTTPGHSPGMGHDIPPGGSWSGSFIVNSVHLDIIQDCTNKMFVLEYRESGLLGIFSSCLAILWVKIYSKKDDMSSSFDFELFCTLYSCARGFCWFPFIIWACTR